MKVKGSNVHIKCLLLQKINFGTPKNLKNQILSPNSPTPPYKLIKSAVGATFNIKMETAEIILGLPPLRLQTKMNSIKHYLKINIIKTPVDLLRKTITSITNSENPHREIQENLKEVFKFLHWKQANYPQEFNTNDAEILSSNDIKRYTELTSSSCKYTKGNIKKYTEWIWSKSTRNQQLMAGEPAVAKPKCSPIPIPIQTERSDEVLFMSLFYPNNLMNSFVYRHTYNAETPLCPRCKQNEETPYHVILECNNKLQMILPLVEKIIGKEGASVNHCNTLVNCSRDPDFVKFSLEILKERDFRNKIDGIISVNTVLAQGALTDS